MMRIVSCLLLTPYFLVFLFFVEGVRVEKKVGKDEIADYQYYDCEKCVPIG